MKRRILLVLLAATLVVLSLSGACAPTPTPAPPAPAPAPAPTPTPTPAPQAEVFKWTAQSFMPRGAAITPYMEQWCQEVGVATGGRLTIEFFAAGEIVPTIETWEAVGKNVFEVALDYPGYWIGKTLLAAYTTGFPYIMKDMGDFFVLLHKFGLEDVIRRAYAEHNLYLVRVHPTHAIQFLSKSPVTKADDFKGMPIRTTGMLAEITQEAGAAPVYFPIGEVYGALEKGLIEGATMGLGTHWDMGHHEVTNYILTPPISPIEGSDLFVNMDAWNALPDDLKMFLDHSAGRLTELLCQHYLGHDVMVMEKMMDYGLEVTYMNEEERAKMAEYTLTVIDNHAGEEPLFDEATAIVKDFMRKRGLLKY